MPVTWRIVFESPRQRVELGLPVRGRGVCLGCVICGWHGVSLQLNAVGEIAETAGEGNVILKQQVQVDHPFGPLTIFDVPYQTQNPSEL